jgi:hypothetical protein
MADNLVDDMKGLGQRASLKLLGVRLLGIGRRS